MTIRFAVCLLGALLGPVGAATGPVRGQGPAAPPAGTPPPAARAAAPAAQQPVARPPYQDSLQRLEQYDSRRPARVQVLRVRNPASDDTVRFQLNDFIVLTVRDLRLALRRAKRPAQDLRLFVDDVALPVPPVFVDTIQRRDVALVRFQLVRNLDTEPTWQLFYKIPGKYEHSGQVNIGFATGQLGPPYPGGSGRLRLVLVQVGWLWAGVAGLAGLGWAFFWLANNSTFIRSDRSNRIPLDQTGQAATISPLYRQVSFSLAKSQVAYWSLLVFASYLMISLVTSALPSIPGGLLGLLGISIANGLFSKLINRTQDTPAPAAMPGQADSTGPSRGWVRDVLTDLNGISVVRLQFVVFNAVVGLYVVRYVLAHWALPDLDSSILALISISSAGFLAQKNSENPAKDPDATAVPPPAGGGTVPRPPLADGGTATAANVGSGPPAISPGGAPGPGARKAVALFGPRAADALRAAPQAPPAAPLEAGLDWNRKLAAFKAAPRYWSGDPAHDIFGDLPAAARGRTLAVAITAVLNGGLDLVATVSGDDATPLAGPVIFLLHPSYPQRVVEVPVQQDRARLPFFAGGGFTLVAMLDAGRTVLACDLKSLPGAPGYFLGN